LVPSFVAGALLLGACGSDTSNPTPDAADVADADAADVADADAADVADVKAPEDLEEQVWDGRPFVVDGAIRHSCMVPGSGWASEAPRSRSDLDDDQLATLCAHWTRVAEGEHASIASFGRFTLELLQLGAPSDLLQQTADALRDEVQHAQIAIALASSYGGQELTPGPLDTAPRTPGQRDAAQILEDTIVGGCINETLAVAQLRMAASQSRIPEIRETLERLAEDESRHASLAWQTAGWMLETWPELRETAEQSFAKATVSIPTTQEDLDPALADHGYLSSEQQRAAVEHAMNKIIAPCKETLLANPS